MAVPGNSQGRACAAIAAYAFAPGQNPSRQRRLPAAGARDDNVTVAVEWNFPQDAINGLLAQPQRDCCPALTPSSTSAGHYETEGGYRGVRSPQGWLPPVGI
jgi:hypothetical protein